MFPFSWIRNGLVGFNGCWLDDDDAAASRPDYSNATANVIVIVVVSVSVVLGFTSGEMGYRFGRYQKHTHTLAPVRKWFSGFWCSNFGFHLSVDMIIPIGSHYKIPDYWVSNVVDIQSKWKAMWVGGSGRVRPKKFHFFFVVFFLLLLILFATLKDLLQISLICMGKSNKFWFWFHSVEFNAWIGNGVKGGRFFLIGSKVKI